VTQARPSALASYVRWILALWLLLLAVISAWRGLILWQTRALLAELGSKMSPPALAAFVALSSLCALGLGVSAAGLSLRRRWGWLPALAFIPFFFALRQGYTWLFMQTGLLWERRWVSLILALCAVGIGVGVLAWYRSRRWLGLD
jgi:hypothetical protein